MTLVIRDCDETTTNTIIEHSNDTNSFKCNVFGCPGEAVCLKQLLQWVDTTTSKIDIQNKDRIMYCISNINYYTHRDIAEYFDSERNNIEFLIG